MRPDSKLKCCLHRYISLPATITLAGAMFASTMLPHFVHFASSGMATSAIRNQLRRKIDDNLLQALDRVDSRIFPEGRGDFVAARELSAGQAGSRYARAQAGSNIYDVLNVEFESARSCNSFNIRGATVFNRFERFADVFVPMDTGSGSPGEAVYNAVLSAPGAVAVEKVGRAVAPPPVSVQPGPSTRQPPEQIVRGGLPPLTGKGVIIAILDSGVDFRNPDFITYDLAGRPTSRLLYLWDTSSNAYDATRSGTKPPLSYPNGASVGTLYSREQLTQDLRSPTPRIAATDLNGHGTACAGIAAGNGNNAPEKNFVKGVAPEADLIAVRLGSGGFENAYAIGAICAWLDSIGGARPLVVSCSFGSHSTGHDGQSVEERQLNARFPLDRTGRALIIAAGNDGSNAIHSEINLAGKPAILDFTIRPSDPLVTKGLISIYFATDDPTTLKTTANPPTRYLGCQLNKLTNQLRAFYLAETGEGWIAVQETSGRPLVADAYIDGGGSVGLFVTRTSSATYDVAAISQSETIANPGTAANAITVGSYDWNDEFDSRGRKLSFLDPCGRAIQIGNLSCYSSLGYTRAGIKKPEIAAPGQWYYASYAKTLDGAGVNPGRLTPDTSGKYCMFNGTSAATPYVAGIVALMLQKKPAITFGEIRRLLEHHATRDSNTGPVPNIRWGHGKLDLRAVERILNAVS
jgi:subtilisin family serine protease